MAGRVRPATHHRLLKTERVSQFDPAVPRSRHAYGLGRTGECPMNVVVYVALANVIAILVLIWLLVRYFG